MDDVVIEKSLYKSMTIVNSWLLVFLFMMIIGGCSSNYEIGDVSKVYCQSDNKETRSLIKAVLNSKGVKVGVDYCALRGFVGGVIHNG